MDQAFALALDVRDGIALDCLSAPDRGTADYIIGLGPAATPPDAVRLACTPSAEAPELWIDRSADGRLYVGAADGELFEIDHPRGAITVRLPSGYSEPSPLLMSQVLPMAAALSGHEIFHASAIAVGKTGVMLAAPSGTGKTSLAAHLVAKGAHLLSDDVATITESDNRLRISVGGIQLHLHAHEAELVLAGSGAEAFEHRGLRDAKVVLACRRTLPTADLGAVALLRRGVSGESPFRRIQPSAAQLLGLSFNVAMRQPDRLIAHLDLCERIAREVAVYEITITPDITARELATLILESGVLASVVR